MTVRLSSDWLQLKVTMKGYAAVHVRPSYEDAAPVPVPVSVQRRDYSKTWGMMRPDHSPAAWPWRDWLVLAAMAAMLLMSGIR